MTRHTRALSSSTSPSTSSGNTNTTPSALPHTLTDGLPLPRLIVFDLDYTLWPFWCDTHVNGPLRGTPDAGRSARDAHGGRYAFYPEVPALLAALQRRTDIRVAAASRTSAPAVARELLALLAVPAPAGEGSAGQAVRAFDFLEIYPGDKKTHFARLRKASGVGYEEMLFFDDESRNRNVETLGVVMQLVRDGVSNAEFNRGVESWRKRNGREKVESGS